MPVRNDKPATEKQWQAFLLYRFFALTLAGITAIGKIQAYTTAAVSGLTHICFTHTY
ncbi:hypothetical protein GCM10028895_43290 [Pontibacter rugosus]